MSGDHSHSHADQPSRRDSHAALESVSVLDIGGDIGAIVVRLPDDTPSGELMACRRGEPTSHFHTGVHLRRIDGGDEAWVALFPEVVAGEYSLLTDDGVEHTPFQVAGGQVTWLEMRAAALVRSR